MNEDEILQLWELFSLNKDELQTNSGLRQAVIELTTFDQINGTSLISKVRDWLSDITDEEVKIQKAQAKVGIESYSIAGGETLKVNTDIDPVVAASAKKRAIAQKIHRTLELDRYLSGVRPRGARVRGIRPTYNYRLTRGYPSFPAV